MAYITVVLQTPETIGQSNSRLDADSTNSTKIANQLENLLSLVKLGYFSGQTLQVTTRDTNPSVGTSGSGSKQTTYTLQ